MNAQPTPEEPLRTVSLDPRFDVALMGTTVHPDQPPRAVYLLDALAAALEGDISAVARIVQDVTAQHGDRAPVFVESIVKPEEEKSPIIVPGNFRGN